VQIYFKSIPRAILRNFFDKEPVWGRDPVALFFCEIIVSSILSLIMRNISIVKALQKMEKINRNKTILFFPLRKGSKRF
jgi:hypothetical protein